MAKSKATETDILIIGGGIAGLSLSILLGKSGLNVHLVEFAAPQSLEKTKATGRTVALMQSSLNVIKATGVWDMISTWSAPLKTMRIIDDNSRNTSGIDSEFHAAEIGLEEFGFNIPNTILRAALFEGASIEKNIYFHTPEGLADYKVESGSVRARLENGHLIAAKLIVGADGRNSGVRKVAEIKCKTRAYDQSAITCLIHHSKSHNDTATEFHRPGGPLAFVPLPGNCSSVVWVEDTARARDLVALKKQEFTQALQDAMQNILGGIGLETGPECWPLSSMKACELAAPRTVLCAEAAHVMSPITAQGLNLSLRDVATLAETIVDAVRLGLDPGSATILDQYRRRRRLDIDTRIFGVDAMNRVVSSDLSLIHYLRRTTLKTIENVTPLKKLAMQAGLAPQIDKGRLAKGKAL